VFYTEVWGDWSFVWGLSSPTLTRGDGTVPRYTSPLQSKVQIVLTLQQYLLNLLKWMIEIWFP